MKKILITGKGSYIGTHVRDELRKHTDKFYVEELDVTGNEWKKIDFSKYDTIYHVAGIAHIRETKENAYLYYKVNRDLAVEIAKKAKDEGVRHFIFMSSMSVYGLVQSEAPITIETEPSPKTNYGKSKNEAEKLLASLESDKFKICIIRPPMVYGENSPGNLSKLIKVVKIIRMFPTIQNKRSYIDVNVLSTYISEIIEGDERGIYLPQNNDYLCTSSYIFNLSDSMNINVHKISIFNNLLQFLIGKNKMVSKIFGNLYYEQ
ncbi:MAG: NAD-dependent epimerase/dehydratase family protein [Erysipelotrichaceae bacterium]